MRGTAHSIQGLAAGIGIAELPGLIGHPVGTMAVIGFGALSAGTVMLPDLDTTTSTAARMLGIPSMIMARQIGIISSAIYARTRSTADVKRKDGHRGITHTLIGALASGVATGALGWWAGPLGVTAAAVALILLARRALLGRAHRHFGIWRLALPIGLVLGLLILVRHLLPATGLGGAVLLGGAVTLGMLVHDLGDALTKDGVPLLWPLKIKGQRWYRITLLKKHAVKLGGLGELLISAGMIVVVGLELVPLFLG